MKQITCPHCGDTYPDFDVAHVCSKGPYAPRLKSKMNERIKQLAEQSFDIIKDNRGRVEYSADSYGIEKFAELIVRECVSTLNEMHMWQSVNNQNYPSAWHDAVDNGIETIKEHFGVEA